MRLEAGTPWHSAAASGDGSAASGAIATADIPVGGGKVFDALKVVVTQPTAGDFKAFSAVCTHQGCTVNGVADGVITCPCHGSTFDIATGDGEAGPATTAPLPAKSVTVGAGRHHRQLSPAPPRTAGCRPAVVGLPRG